MKETNFKHTDIGLIPQDWVVKKIGEFTDVVTGATPSTHIAKYWDNGTIRWMSSGEVNLKYVREVKGRITEEGYNSTSTHIVPSRSVLIGLAGQGKTRGTAAFNLVKLCTNQSIGSILPNDLYESLYLYHFLDSMYNDLRLLSAGDGGRGGLNKQLLLGYKVKLPTSIEEQRRIAEALLDIDQLLDAMDAQIAKKQAIKTGAMQQLLTGKTRLAGFTEPWIEKRVGTIGYTYAGLTGKTKEDFGRGNSQYITFLNVLNNPVLNPSLFENVNVSSVEKQNKAHKNDLFFNTSSETPEEVGICSVLDVEIDNLYLNSFCFGFRITDPNVYGKYLAYFWRSACGREIMTALAQGATRYNLSKVYFNAAVISLPSQIEEQVAIAEVLSNMDAEIQALQDERNKYALIKQGMMQELLTGKTRI